MPNKALKQKEMRSGTHVGTCYCDHQRLCCAAYKSVTQYNTCEHSERRQQQQQ